MDICRVGRRIRNFRLQQGMTQEVLAETADISVSFLSYVERGKKQVSLDSLIRLAEALHVTVDQLLGSLREANEPLLVADMCDLLGDCSDGERLMIMETSRALKQALRERDSS